MCVLAPRSLDSIMVRSKPSGSADASLAKCEIGNLKVPGRENVIITALGVVQELTT